MVRGHRRTTDEDLDSSLSCDTLSRSSLFTVSVPGGVQESSYRQIRHRAAAGVDVARASLLLHA